VVYILQKGYIRTCTNYTRVLLEKNFAAKVVTVAKHDDREGLYKDMGSYIELVKAQRGWPHDLEPHLIDALHSGDKLRYVVCIKNPYSWFHSVSKTGPSMHRPDPSNPWPVIENFNERYRAWMDIVKERPDSSYVVRHEDLLGDSFQPTMHSICGKLGLSRVLSEYTNESRDVLGQSKGRKRIGNSSYDQRLNARIMPLTPLGEPSLGAQTFNRIREEIDWDTMEFYGYASYNDSYETLYRRER
jgi:hypothetical protein